MAMSAYMYCGNVSHSRLLARKSKEDDWGMGDVPPPEAEVPQDEDLLMTGALPDASPAPVAPPVSASPRASIDAPSFRGFSPLRMERTDSRSPTRPIPPAVPWRRLSSNPLHREPSRAASLVTAPLSRLLPPAAPNPPPTTR